MFSGNDDCTNGEHVRELIDWVEPKLIMNSVFSLTKTKTKTLSTKINYIFVMLTKTVTKNC